jgi:L-threonylcarbamoyladenylate synthase
LRLCAHFVKTIQMLTMLTHDAKKAAEVIKNGGLAAFPTETVYGLGAAIFDVAAVGRIFEAKGRPPDNPLIAHVGALSQIQQLATVITPHASDLIDAYFPGPLTLVLPKSHRVPDIASAGLDTIGIRMPAHELAREFLKECGTPVAAPSANRSGRPSPTTWQAVLEDLDGRIDCILQGDATEIGLESTVVDCSTAVPVLLRSGAVSIEELRRIVPEMLDAESNGAEPHRSPGTRYRHYSPRAQVIVCRSGDVPRDRESAFIGLSDPGERANAHVCATVNEYAHDLFEFFREADRRGIARIYCETVPETGVGGALMDRIRRASAG